MRQKAGCLFWVFSILINVSAFNPAGAVEMSFQPRLETGMMFYSFESEGYSNTVVSMPSQFNSGYNNSQASFEITDVIPFVGIAGTIFLNRFFLDVGGQYAFNGNDNIPISASGYNVTSFDFDNNYINTAYAAWEQELRADFDRRDLAISLGYALTPNCSVFAGYKWAETQFDANHRGRFHILRYDSDEVLDGKSGSDVWGHERFLFKYGGPFVGAVQGWNFSRYRFFKGTLTGRLALAFLEGKVELEESSTYIAITWIDDQPVADETRRVEGDSNFLRLDTKGETLGLTVGIGWSGETAVDGLTYFLGISAYRYEFDAERDSPENGADLGQSNINETAFLYKLGLSYSF